MQFNQISYFLRACDTLNFTRAAEICHVSQPSLSAAIRKLEEELGGELFSRHGREFELTALGEVMRIQLGRIEQAKNAASFAASEFVRGDFRSINLGLMCTLSVLRLVSAIASYRFERSNNEIFVHDVSEQKAHDLLLSGALDFLIMAQASDLPTRFCEQRLADEPMLLAMHETHTLSNRTSVSISDLQGYAYVDRLQCELRETFFRELMSQDISVQTVLRTEREDLVVESVRAGVGLSILPQSVAQDAGLKTCVIEEFPAARRICIVTVKDRPLNPLVQQFINHVLSNYSL